MKTRPSNKMLALLVGGGIALAVALGAASSLPGASLVVVSALLLALGAIAVVVLFWFAVAAQMRRERTTMQKTLNSHIETLLAQTEVITGTVAELREEQATTRERVEALTAAQDHLLDTVKTEGVAARANFGALTEDVSGARRDAGAAALEAQGALRETLDVLRDQDARTRTIASSARRLQTLGETSDARLRKLLNLVRAESRDRMEASGAHAGSIAEIAEAVRGLARLEDAIRTLEKGVANAGKSSTDTGAAVRRVQNYLRKEGNIQIVLDRIIASERRTLGALETTRWELGDELARTADAQESLRDGMKQQAGALQDELARTADAQEGLRDGAKAQADTLVDEIGTRLRELLESVSTRFDALETAGSDREREHGQHLVATIGGLKQVIVDGMASLETSNRAWTHGLSDRLEQIDRSASDRDNGRGEVVDAALHRISGEVSERMDHLDQKCAERVRELREQLDGIASTGQETAERSSSILADVEGARKDLARLERTHAGAADSLVTGAAASDLPALRTVVEELKAHIESSAKSQETELRRFALQMNDRTHRQLKRETIEGVRQTESLLQLIPRVETRERRFPATGWWALSADTVLYLSDYLMEHRPQRILEIGSGASTIWLGTFAQRIGASYVSIEHDESFAAHTRSMIVEHGLEDTVDLRHAPLTPIEIEGQEYNWYDLAAFEDIGGGFDLLVVDGPPEATGDMARYPAMPVLAERLSERAAVVLDDVHREAETESLRRWAESNEGFEIVQTGLSRTGLMRRRPNQ